MKNNKSKKNKRPIIKESMKRFFNPKRSQSKSKRKFYKLLYKKNKLTERYWNKTLTKVGSYWGKMMVNKILKTIKVLLTHPSISFSKKLIKQKKINLGFSSMCEPIKVFDLKIFLLCSIIIFLRCNLLNCSKKIKKF